MNSVPLFNSNNNCVPYFIVYNLDSNGQEIKVSDTFTKSMKKFNKSDENILY